LVVCVLAYGLLIPTLGYYWDDWPYAWINHMYGPSGYPDYVALDRPYSAWIFMLLTSILGEQPLGYHISAMLLFWLSTVLFWFLLRLLWPEHNKQALWAALLMAVYPGFLGHPQAIIYNHHFAAMALYLFSLIGMVRAIQTSESPTKLWRSLAWWHLPSMAALMLSQFSIEYFIGWEVLRPLIAWLALRQIAMSTEKRVGMAILHTLPYYLVTAVFLLWRVFIFRFPTYSPIRIDEADFVLGEWFLDVLDQFLNAVVLAWGRAFPQLSQGDFSRPFWLVYLGLILLTSILAFVVLYKFDKSKVKQASKVSNNVSFGASALLLALVGLAFAGWPFWLTDLNIDIDSTFKSRFTLAFIPWVALLLTTIFHWFSSIRHRWTRVTNLVVIALLVGGSTGYHLWNANYYRNQWLVTQRYFQQLVQRIPGLEPGTSVVINDLQSISLNEDDSLTAILNWIYAPDNTDPQLDYIVQYLSVRLGWEIPDLKPDLPIEQPFRSLHFSGSTNQMLVVYYQPPGCLRVLDGEHPERLPRDFPDRMIPALSLSNLSVIKTEQNEHAVPPLHLFDVVSSETWCLYFEEADLEAQRENWTGVAELGDHAFELEDQSNEVSELFVFIEGYLRVGRLEDAEEISSMLSERSSGYYNQGICKLWRDVESETPGGFDPGYDLASVYARFCSGK